jgi:cell division protein FtsI (penicillin-binding protein 3)
MIQKYYGKNPVAFFNHLERFGLTEPTGIEILGEPAPYFIKPDDKRLWNATTLPWLSTGYNARLTPLQILTFYNAIANGGYRVKPMLIEEIRKTTKVVRKYPVQVSKEPVCSKESLAIIQKMLEGVVQRGTAKNIYTPNYAIAGKTGTAQKVINGQYQKTYEASFVGYFPAKNPVYSIYVLLDEPQEGFYGAAVAAPVFQQIANQLFAMNQKAQEFRDIKNTISAELPTVKKAFSKDLQTIYNELSIAYQGTDTGNWVSSSIIPGKKAVKISSDKISIYNKVIPNLKGMALKDAIYLLENMKVKVLYEGQGKVVTQSLDTGTPVKPDMTIMLKCE